MQRVQAQPVLALGRRVAEGQGRKTVTGLMHRQAYKDAEHAQKRIGQRAPVDGADKFLKAIHAISP